MSLWAEIWAYEQPCRNSGERFTLVAVAHFVDRNGEGWPGQKSLAGMTMQAPRTISRHLKQLEKRGVLARRPRFRRDGSRTSDLYILNAPFERLGPPDQQADVGRDQDSTTRQNDGGTIRQSDRGYRSDASEAPVIAAGTPRSDCPGSDPSEIDHRTIIEKRERDRSRSCPATYLPNNFEPDEESVALVQELGLDLSAEVANFVDYHRNAGKFRDWQARFRTFIRKSERFPVKSVLEREAAPRGRFSAGTENLMREYRKEVLADEAPNLTRNQAKLIARIKQLKGEEHGIRRGAGNSVSSSAEREQAIAQELEKLPVRQGYRVGDRSTIILGGMILGIVVDAGGKWVHEEDRDAPVRSRQI
jgi:DNA-binding transcriptional ArsR family regulator